MIPRRENTNIHHPETRRRLSQVNRHQYLGNLIDGVMISMLNPSAEDRGIEPRSGQTKDGKIGICCVPAKHAVLRRKSKDWLARNQDNMSEWRDCCFSELAL
jgi:hypothetical protein